MITEAQISSFKSFIHEIAVESSSIIKSYFRKPVSIDVKEDNSPVTIADRKAEEYLREQILKKFPDHGIIGEEFSNINPDAEFTWVLDPIDGTKSFVCGAVTFGTLIGLLHKKKPLLGSIYLPAIDEFLIGDGKTSRLNGKEVKIRPCNHIRDAILITTDSAALYRVCPQIFKEIIFHRGLGDCYGYYLVASGFADIMIDLVMSPWDLLPLIPIIRGAGGIISGIRGETAESAHSAVAAAHVIQQDVVKILSSS
jgi:histidinol phosphatase-like enzyme (inositol monophosphatase family)